MTPKYSILYFKQELNNYINDIRTYLNEGIKVFWFGSSVDKTRLRETFRQFADEFFLQSFDISAINEKQTNNETDSQIDSQTNSQINRQTTSQNNSRINGQSSSQLNTQNDSQSLHPTIIIDGIGITDTHSSLISFLEENILQFNAAQYKVEHNSPDSNIVVKASAGTGKTTVMIDRILYLMHMVPGLDMSEIYMITFTNEATNQMNDRLQEMLMKKYALTKNKRYLTWLEQQSQMHISTIDSLAYDLFRRFGSGVGFGRDLQITPMEKDRKDLIKDLLSEELSSDKSIAAQIGMNYSQASKLIDDYWKELTRKGYTMAEVMHRDWGETDPFLAELQRVIKAVLRRFEGRYKQIKLEANAISIDDLFFDFGHYMLSNRISCEGLDMKYLFVDEFQDTDATQIMSFAKLVRDIGVHLFVVGDVKQSIYGFKGATDKAFDILDKKMDSDLEYFSLRNNYRTCRNLMGDMERYFFEWSRDGLLKYEDSVRPFNTDIGKVEMTLVENKYDYDGLTLEAISEALESIEMDIRAGRKKPGSKSRVAVLVRSANKADYVANLCRANGMSVVLNSDRPFFRSRAVRDFYAMISSYIFVDQPVYMFNYLMTPYARVKGEMSIRELEKISGDDRELRKYLTTFMADTGWLEHQKEFRTRPVLSVIKDMIEQDDLIDNFIARNKAELFAGQLSEAAINRQATIDAKRYRLCLDKLMDMIQQRMDGEFATLYDLYIYLTLMIATNREDKEPDVDLADDYKSVYIMTVHKSKGLEFDTVIMPAMGGNIIPREDTTILVNDEKVGWVYLGKPGEKQCSRWYKELRVEAINRGMEEETRILYVAMTRAVNKLVLLVSSDSRYESWSTLIRKVGLINE